MRESRISILPFERADLSEFRDSLKSAAEMYDLKASFATDVYLTKPASAGEVARKQRDAISVIESAKISIDQLSAKADLPKLNLLVTTEDLSVSNFNFVFGLSNPESGVAIVSVARLLYNKSGENIDTSLVKERILKEAAHEIGHLLRLPHCKNRTCLMSFSNSIIEVDAKSSTICDDCGKRSEAGRFQV